MTILLENKIKEFIKSHKVIKPSEIEEEFKLSKSTTRRLLIKLGNEGFIKRNFGEVIYNEVQIHTDKLTVEEIDKNKAVKLSLASTAAVLAKDYKHVFVDAGSTCYYLLEKLNKSINLYTNSIFNAMHAIEMGFENVNVIGGFLKKRTLSTVSHDLSKYENLTFQIAFLGVNGIDDEGNLTTPEIQEGYAKNYFASHSDLVVVLAEKQKFGVRSFYNFKPKNKTILVVTNYRTKQNYKNLFIINNKE
ncbi:DeoR/GlpR family DNA-binding transcription regulator [Mycoplasma iguanae]|uniref:DeoR/GlpR family DNA-binding transcription regulator n=1 Tax=Mycoplasma iguanae TaxID=292461 RepID=A0ABY5R9S1_9MOLU|nr:DeoR/GlpR family DNA-binding transcription regulator [Mycoplasma iguanae]UVD81534.1 DeoR/GlpR family DNA-binding transcription regulator [Mycoplasma iguanae]